uniref:intramembrane prenyl-peptidase Rce1 n=1 Tax=Phytophthora ramorum TaxID=164328 RepID=H3GXG3_PHYRM
MRFSVTATTAVIACSCMAAAYVGVLYTLPHAIRRLPRDHPTHILARFLLICIFCAICPFVLAVFYDHDEASMSFAQWLGIRWEGLVQAIVIPLFTTAVLFSGSLLANALRLLNVSKQFHSNGLWFAVKNSALYYSITRDRLPSLRTYVLGPLTEEFVFRSCMVPLLVCAQFTVKQIVLGSPLMFGAAHLHHFMEYVRHGRSPKDAALTVGHFASIFLVHVFCNVMGFPDLSFFNPESSLHPFRLVLLGAYFFGIYGFSLLLMPLTEPSIYSSEMWNVTASTTEHELVFGYSETL